MIEKFFDNITGENERICQLLWEIIGVVISGYNPKALFLLIGAKHSGKSTFIRLLKLLVGAEQFMEINSLNDLTANKWLVGGLIGKKLCACSEQPRVSLSYSTIAMAKRITGGDIIQGERKYQDPFYFRNNASIIVATNHKLILPDNDDDAFASRIVSVPFRRTLTEAERIPDVEYLLMRESGYIVYRACEALKGLIANNFVFTSIGENMSDWNHTSELDALPRFIDECCEFVSSVRETTDNLYDSFTAYCDGYPPIPKAVFGRKLSQECELEQWRTSTQRGFVGIRLLQPEDDGRSN